MVIVNSNLLTCHQCRKIKKVITKYMFGLVWFYGVKGHFQKYLSYIVAVSFIGGGNRSTRRKPRIPSDFSSTCNRTCTRLSSADTVPSQYRRREADLPEVYRLIELAVKSLLAMFSLLNLRFT